MSGSGITQTEIKLEENKTILNRKDFEKEVYMSIEEAIHELSKRKNDLEIDKKIQVFFKDTEVPKEFFNNEPKGILFRQLASSNYEISRFLIITDSLGVKPIFCEYYDDKFVSKNEIKRYLGKIPFHFGFGKNNHNIIEFENIIDFSQNDGKLIKDINTLWGQSLVDFHHELLQKNYPFLSKDNFFDNSYYFKHWGNQAEFYYKYYIAVFIKNTILFENFMLEDDFEKEFVKNIFLPAFRFVRDYFGIKPLIVALEPTDIEGDIFWYCHNHTNKEFVKSKLKI